MLDRSSVVILRQEQGCASLLQTKITFCIIVSTSTLDTKMKLPYEIFSNMIHDQILGYYSEPVEEEHRLLSSPHQHCQTSAAYLRPPTPTMTAA